MRRHERGLGIEQDIQRIAGFDVFDHGRDAEAVGRADDRHPGDRIEEVVHGAGIVVGRDAAARPRDTPVRFVCQLADRMAEHLAGKPARLVSGEELQVDRPVTGRGEPVDDVIREEGHDLVGSQARTEPRRGAVGTIEVGRVDGPDQLRCRLCGRVERADRRVGHRRTARLVVGCERGDTAPGRVPVARRDERQQRTAGHQLERRMEREGVQLVGDVGTGDADDRGSVFDESLVAA